VGRTAPRADLGADRARRSPTPYWRQRLSCAASRASKQVADSGQNFGDDAEVAKVVEDDQVGARDEFSGVMNG
jgi:hypothetical protein